LLLLGEKQMPNWCTTNFTVSGTDDDLKHFIATATSDGCFDFNRIVPMPEELHSSVDDLGRAYAVYYGDPTPMLDYSWVKDKNIATLEQLRQHFDLDPVNRRTADLHKANIDRYGFPTWYEWSIANWGTKWNACYTEISAIEDGYINIVFDTAWSFPDPIFEKLAAMFPMLTFTGHAVEHGMGWAIDFESKDGSLVTLDIDYDEAYPAEEDEDDDLEVEDLREGVA
jgi:hypothetical protein